MHILPLYTMVIAIAAIVYLSAFIVFFINFTIKMKTSWINYAKQGMMPCITFIRELTF